MPTSIPLPAFIEVRGRKLLPVLCRLDGQRAPQRAEPKKGTSRLATVTPEARAARGQQPGKDNVRPRLPVSRSTQPIDLRMKNSRCSSIRSA